MTVKLLTEHDLEFLSLKGDFTDLSESTLVKIPHCWKSHVAAHMFFCIAQTKEILEVHYTQYACAYNVGNMTCVNKVLWLRLVHTFYSAKIQSISV